MAKISEQDQNVINEALDIIQKYSVKNRLIDSTSIAQREAILRFGLLEREVFGCFFLTSEHKIIKFETLFKGTINKAQIYIREIAKRALELNAASLVLVHNHPSGCLEASRADIDMTSAIKSALRVFEITILDHIIVGNNDAASFAEMGLL